MNQLTEDEYQARLFPCLTCDEMFSYGEGVALGFDFNRFCDVHCAFTYEGPTINGDIRQEIDLRYRLESQEAE